MKKKIQVCDDGLVFLRDPRDRWVDLGDDGELEAYDIEYDAEEDPYHFYIIGKWFRPVEREDGTVEVERIKGKVTVRLTEPLDPEKEYTALDLLFAPLWEEWQVEEA